MLKNKKISDDDKADRQQYLAPLLDIITRHKIIKFVGIGFYDEPEHKAVTMSKWTLTFSDAISESNFKINWTRSGRSTYYLAIWVAVSFA